MTIMRPRPVPGLYEKPFWDFVQARELRLQRCTGCGAWRYPPGPTCPNCLSEGFAWQPVAGTGRVLSWVVFHRQYFPDLPVPYTVVSCALDEGPLLIANLINPGTRPLALDASVHIIFEETQSADGKWIIFQWELD